MNIFVLNFHKIHQIFFFFPLNSKSDSKLGKGESEGSGRKELLGGIVRRNRSGKRGKDIRRKMLCTVTLLWSQKMQRVLQTCYCGKWAVKTLLGSDSVPVCEAQEEAVRPFLWPERGVFLPGATVPLWLGHNANASVWVFSMFSWGKMYWNSYFPFAPTDTCSPVAYAQRLNVLGSWCWLLVQHGSKLCHIGCISISKSCSVLTIQHD